jgi:hypothetical protein
MIGRHRKFVKLKAKDGSKREITEKSEHVERLRFWRRTEAQNKELSKKVNICAHG